ncbi:uncharacterized protein si:ch211-149e23.4 isoform X2 [Osmerus mordax]|uniref:uncharacterized protein si:ch211-149e23.4 isoform X2 n=1 Tax=Osmerus mordax TaxID=8014 RepID=UPI00350F747D
MVVRFIFLSFNDSNMEGSGLFILGFVLYVTHCLEMLGATKPDIEMTHNVTGVLGEDVYLHCQYLGQNNIIYALWKRQIDSKLKRLTGYHNNKAFTKDPDFSSPASATNLTVRMSVSSLEAEGEYICVFVSDEEEFTDTMVLNVLARPVIQTSVTEETANGTHYQSVTCSAVNGKPRPEVRWMIRGTPVEMTNTSHTNGTVTVRSVLRFPTHLQDQDRVTCEVQHPTLPEPAFVTVNVETFVAPNVTIETDLVMEEGVDIWKITCRVYGGRPKAGISLALPIRQEDERGPWREWGTISDTQASSYHLPARLYEGQNITCVFDHPMFTHRELRTVTLPAFYLSAVQLVNSESTGNYNKNQAMKAVVLKEGHGNSTITLQVIGDVPRYTVICIKDDGPLPEGMEVTGSVLGVQGPVELTHAGLYECEASYQHLKASVKLNVTVSAHEKQPVLVTPRIRIDTQERLEDRLIECLAAEAVPAANLSWLLPEGVSGLHWSNFTSHNGTHSVRAVLVLPVCLQQELSVKCMIDHPAFEKPKSRRITLPVCAPANITIDSSSEWEDSTAYTQVQCSVDSPHPLATVSWSVGSRETRALHGVQILPEVHASGRVSVQSRVRFPTAMFSGQNVTCAVEHASLERTERRHILVPELGPVMSVSVRKQTHSSLWLAECEYRGEGVGVHLSWVLAKNTTCQTSSSLHSYYEGLQLHTRLTYEFPLALYEGQDLTCLIQNEHGLKARRTAHVPIYDISFIRVLNQTTPLNRPHGRDFIIHRLALQENVHGQRVLFRVIGSVPTYNLTCHRSDGSVALVEGSALVFPSAVTERETGLYTCQASFYHHKATTLIQLEINSEDQELMYLVIVCFSTAMAVTLLVIVTLCVFCKSSEAHQPSPKKRESLAALTSLMQGPCSPDLRKPAVGSEEGQQYVHFLSYNIILDVKSTV